MGARVRGNSLYRNGKGELAKSAVSKGSGEYEE